MFGYENYNVSGYQPYEPTTKYSSFFTPYRDLDINDVKDFMRDRFESILNDQGDPDYSEFTADSENYNLRPVAVENAYQIHIIQSFAELPKDMACVEYLCISNSAYAPFIPLSCAVNSLNDYYSYVTDEYRYDENAASCIYKFVNRLCGISRKYYGLPVIELIENYEDI
ncbi:MAG: C69 family dipeptidase [Mycoplasmoidaceae bacterium]|nr:C69 family dipeptidase [Mycoplasmoidaceae bacterium]